MTANIELTLIYSKNKQIPLFDRETKIELSLHLYFKVAVFMLEPEKKTKFIILV